MLQYFVYHFNRNFEFLCDFFHGHYFSYLWIRNGVNQWTRQIYEILQAAANLTNIKIAEVYSLNL